VSKFEIRARLTLELTDTQLGAVIWISKFDETITDVFELQDRVSESAVRRIAPHIYGWELKRIRAKHSDSLKAYDRFLRAIELMHNSSRQAFESAHDLFEGAIAHDPYYAAAHAWYAYWHVLRVGQGWSTDREIDTSEADRLAAKAVDCDSMEPMALAVHGHVAAYLNKNFDLALERFDKALAINPNSAPAWLWSAATYAWKGDGSSAIERIQWAIKLTPYDPLMYAYNGIAGMAYLADGQYERAIEFGLRCKQENRSYTHAYRLLAIALVLAGRNEEAKIAARQLLELEPDLTVDRFRNRYPGSESAHVDLYCDALRRAGVPSKN
jgi:tetratricopeptide (TPR) repeat protein